MGMDNLHQNVFIAMRCAGCNKVLEVGDLYIEDTPSGFLKEESESSDVEFDEMFNEISTMILGGTDGKIYFCSDCTKPGGDYMFHTYYGDEEE